MTPSQEALTEAKKKIALLQSLSSLSLLSLSSLFSLSSLSLFSYYLLIFVKGSVREASAKVSEMESEMQKIKDERDELLKRSQTDVNVSPSSPLSSFFLFFFLLALFLRIVHL